MVLAGLATGVGILGFVLGGHLAGAAPDGLTLASRFERPDAERAARTACSSRAAFVVLDTFGFIKPADIDDRLSDPAVHAPGKVRHGDIVAAIAKASHADVVGYQTNPVFSIATLTADFGRLAEDIETGRLAKPAAVVSSIVLPVDLKDVEAVAPGVAPFSNGGAAARRGEILKLVTDGFDDRNPYAQVARQLDRLRAAGVPVFVAAGNTGPDRTVNMLALVDGVYAVGSLGRDGVRTDYTSAPELVSVWSPGFVVVTEAGNGLSVSGGRSVELEGAALPEESAAIAEFSGKRAEGVVREIPRALSHFAGAPSRWRNRYVSTALAPGVYRTQDLMMAYGHSPALGTVQRAIAEGPYMHYPSDTIFRTDVDGRLVFDPVGDRSVGQLKVADATSFAAPNLCAAELFPSPRWVASRN